ncbi:MAG: LPS export ABC transporter periplasmic protein LptC, partial [Prevotellaceae bacterium]|nr:LPS export ABC transporter periplasmic protein LptC [Prevotellaceae bacterium]
MKHIVLSLLVVFAFVACNESKEHTAPAINDKDSVATMISYGVNTLISDSGVMKYRIISERWEVNEVTVPPKWSFIKGVFFQQFDKDFHIAATITADTAWFYNTLQLWELRGRVEMRNVNGTLFNSEELFWDQRNHELYSHKYARLFTPERQIEGTEFRSDEYMTHYYVNNSKGAFPTGDLMEDEPAPPPSPDAANDSAVVIPDVKPHSAPVARPRQVLDASTVNRAKQSINDLRKNMN